MVTAGMMGISISSAVLVPTRGTTHRVQMAPSTKPTANTSAKTGSACLRYLHQRVPPSLADDNRARLLTPVNNGAVFAATGRSHGIHERAHRCRGRGRNSTAVSKLSCTHIHASRITQRLVGRERQAFCSRSGRRETPDQRRIVRQTALLFPGHRLVENYPTVSQNHTAGQADCVAGERWSTARVTCGSIGSDGCRRNGNSAVRVGTDGAGGSCVS